MDHPKGGLQELEPLRAQNIAAIGIFGLPFVYPAGGDIADAGQHARIDQPEGQLFLLRQLAQLAGMGPELGPVAPDHHLVNQKNISIQDLQKETFIIREEGSGTRTAIQKFFREKGAPLESTINMSSNEAIKQAVQAGLGLGIVSVHTLELELETKRLQILDVVDFPILRHWFIMQRKGKRQSPAAQAFKSFVLEQARELIRLP